MWDTLLRSSLLSSVGNALSKSIFFSVSILLSHRLTVNEYAEYSLVYTLCILLGTISAASFGIIITNLVSNRRISAVSLINNRALICLFLSIFSSVVTMYFVDFIFLSNTFVFIVIVLASFLYSIESMMLGGLIGHLEFKVILVGNIIKSFSFFILVFISGYYFDINIIILLIIVYNLIGVIYFKPKIMAVSYNKHENREKKEIIAEVLPLVITGLLIPGFLWSLNYLIYDRNTAQDSSLFSVLIQINQIVLFLATSMTAPILPIMNRYTSKIVDQINLIIPTAIISVFTWVVYYFNIFSYIFGNNILNDQNRHLVGFMLFSSIIMVFKNSLFRKNIQVGKLYLSLLNNVIWLIIMMTYLGVYGFGVKEVVTGFLIAHIITCITSMILYTYFKVFEVESFINQRMIFLSSFFFISWWILL
ncbi:MATE family efflux transporter [Photobacterium leiognathi]|uniref:hypothetical protein n=1 Tax=Photobacterium leiognathi TaxID=553611 RepID=UPI002982B6CC|nr:hypothetical protein [Photobacterium leiognathi]